MDAVVVSDVHCDGPDSPTQAAFLRFLATRPADRLVLAGDIFHGFAAPRGTILPPYQPVIDALRSFDLVVLPGNHDWLLPGVLAANGARTAGCVMPASRVDVELGGLRARVAHGDEVDGSARYRGAHRALRSRGFTALLDVIGAAAAWRLLHRLAGPLGVGSPDPGLVSAQRALAEAWINEGFELVILGHTHAPECTHLRRGTFLNPGDWVTHRSYGFVSAGRVELRRFEDGSGGRDR